jgi:hypothetical protein
MLKFTKYISLLISVACFTQTFASVGDTIFVAQNNPNANDGNAGTENSPLKTILAGTRRIQAGEVLLVKEGIYTDHNCDSWGCYGIMFNYSGTAQNPIIVQANPGDNVIIDQGMETVGFNIQTRNYITIRGFEIRNCSGGGVYTHDTPTYIVVENCYIHNIDGGAGSNVGGIKADGCDRCEFRNNIIHDIFVAGVNKVFANGGNSAGIHSYGMQFTTIENNDLSEAYNGVYHKKSSGDTGCIIQNNTIHDVTKGIYYGVQGANDNPHIDQRVYENVFYNMEHPIEAGSNDTREPSHGLKIAGNIFDAPNGIGLINYNNVEIWNNVFLNMANAYASGAIGTNKDMPTEWITYCNYNAYFPSAIRFNLHIYTTEEYYTSVADWQTNTGYDLNSITNDPLFADAANHNYTLSANSPLIGSGKDGSNIGSAAKDTSATKINNSYIQCIAQKQTNINSSVFVDLLGRTLSKKAIPNSIIYINITKSRNGPWARRQLLIH